MTFELQCAWRLPIFLPPDARMARVTVGRMMLYSRATDLA